MTSDAPIVDCHAHVFTRDLPLVSGAWAAPNYDYTYTDYLADLDRYGIHFGVLSGLSISGTYNEYTIGAPLFSRRLRATAIVAPDTDFYTLRRMRDEGVVGIRLQLVRKEVLPDLTSDAYRLLLRRVRDLDWHVHLALESRRLPPILDLMEKAGIKIVLDHFAHPEPDLGVSCPGWLAGVEAVQRGRTWIKLAAAFRLAGPETWREPDFSPSERIGETIAAELFNRVGAERLLWGSDAPFVGYEGRMTYDRALAQLNAWAPDPATRRALSNTALKFYFA
ncbi:amidohydrolase family protein [Niveispirillum sp. KHB5.9]|uniref:amidohydrolase family protein n=1 Tax=Niveispirillum sp. KHB5.9 TaxID=3400269 RepID=UPI003A8B24E0